jgi:hypothetical protein
MTGLQTDYGIVAMCKKHQFVRNVDEAEERQVSRKHLLGNATGSAI